MASPATLKALIEALEAEQARRRKAQFGGHEDPRQWLLDTLQQMAQRLAATVHLFPLDLGDMAPAEQLAAHYLPEDLRPAGLPTVAEIWAKHLTPTGARRPRA
jgi:hypothetical protein